MELKEMIQWAIFGKKSYQVHVILWCLCATKISAICTQFCSPAILIFSAFHIKILKTYWEKAAQRHLPPPPPPPPHPPQKNQNWKLLLPLITSTITQFKFLFVLLLLCSLVFQMYYIDIVIQFQAKGSVIFMSMQPDVILSLLRKKSAAYRPEKTVKRTLFAAQRIHRGHQLK